MQPKPQLGLAIVLGRTVRRNAEGFQPSPYLAVPGLSVLAVEVGAVAVLIPPGAFVGHGTVGYRNIVVPVLGGERAALVVSEGVPCGKRSC